MGAIHWCKEFKNITLAGGDFVGLRPDKAAIGALSIYRGDLLTAKRRRRPVGIW
jgi:hypothetical protein